MKTQIKSEYAAPQCAVHEIQPEGSLCVSLQQLFEYEDEYNWYEEVTV